MADLSPTMTALVIALVYFYLMKSEGSCDDDLKKSDCGKLHQAPRYYLIEAMLTFLVVTELAKDNALFKFTSAI